ncbi:hypothetical protein ISN45_Aa01g036910 [Arabidopsis thaliana x Arabidopsis arenosa]|uniref:Transmembrane protein n=1 Tax=Arabidopsis thaliana x Arabidopsis arenosa TaxID=1240361 RepID=A0A8T2C9K8_9BRAS|nr:hypothetical protein ISN45_Aa01g036910 [Arabidopsis thaliana x Arabidopsis arenosa]
MVTDREERRRRIMERGSDRLALITGQLHNLDPSSPSSSSSSSSASHNRTYSESFMPQTKSDHHLIRESPSLKYQFKEEVNARSEEPKLSTSVLHKPLKSEPTKPEEATRSVKSQNQRPKSFFSSKKLNASIISSERTRSLSSLTIAAFVVLFPRLNIISSDTILALRPLWLLILTDCAIVMSHLTMETSGGGLSHEMEDERKSKDGNNGENWSDAEKLLERGVVVYQALRGIFIDCSLYMVVVVIFGASLF